MKHTLWALLLISGLFTIPQRAMAIFVFNPTLTMHQAYRSSSPSPAKAVMPNATKRTARRQVKAKHPAEEAGTGKVEIKHFGFPLFGMNNGASGH